MELDAALSRTLDLHALDFPVALEQFRGAIESLPAGGALSILTGDRALEDPFPAVSVEKGYEFSDVSEPATLCFLVYRPF